MGSGGDGAPYRVVARLIDQQGKDVAQRNFEVRERFALTSLECRPARVTLRLGRISSATVLVPAAPQSRIEILPQPPRELIRPESARRPAA